MLNVATDVKTLMPLIRLMGQTGESANLSVDEKGIHAGNKDVGNISMVLMDLPAEMFDIYECDTPQRFVLDIPKTLKILSLQSNSVMMSCDEEMLTFTLDGGLTRNLRLTVPQDPELKAPKIEYTSHAHIEANVLQTAFRASDFSEAMRISILKDGVRISQTTDIEAVSYDLPKECVKDGSQDCSAAYPIQILSSFIKVAPAVPMDLDLGNDMPLVVTPAIEGASVQYLIAPLQERQ